MTLEYLEVGHEGDPVRRRFAWLTVLLIAIVAGGLVGSAALVRAQANARLELAIAHATRDAHAGESIVLSTLQYARPMIWSTSVGADVRAGLRSLVQRSAHGVTATLQDTRSAVEGTFVPPWDGTQRQAKEAVLALVDAHTARFDQIAADATEIGSVFSRPEPSDATARALLRASGAEPPTGR